jgi:hypothetical protein
LAIDFSIAKNLADHFFKKLTKDIYPFVKFKGHLTTVGEKGDKSKFDKIKLIIRQYSLHVPLLKMPSILDFGLF